MHFFCDRRDRADDQTVGFILRNLTNKRSFNFKNIQWQSSQVREASVACPKVVYRDFAALISQVIQGCNGLLFIDQGGSFGDLKANLI